MPSNDIHHNNIVRHGPQPNTSNSQGRDRMYTAMMAVVSNANDNGNVSGQEMNRNEVNRPGNENGINGNGNDQSGNGRPGNENGINGNGNDQSGNGRPWGRPEEG